MTPELDISLPDTWFAIDPDRSTRRASLEADVDEWTEGHPVLTALREELLQVLWEFAEEADALDALFAAMYWEPGEHGPTAANLMVLKGERNATDVQTEINTLMEVLARPQIGDQSSREVSRIDLPIGPAVRLRGLGKAGHEPGEPALVIDVAQIWIPVEHELGMVVVTGTTPCLDVGDDVAEVVDTVATTVRYVTA
ncbi:MAG: hypothetical protein AB1679_33590 [Actinomycetota bacterium]